MLILVTLVVLILGTVSYASLDKRQAAVPSTQATAQVLSKYEVGPPDAQELLELVNAERARVGVAPLVIDEGLNTSVQIKADDMDNNDYFGHVDANGKHGYEHAYEYSASCKVPSENIVGTDTTSGAINWWNGSSQHRAAMINEDYTLTGFGIKYVDRIPLERITSSKPVNTDLVDSYVVVQHFCTVK